MHNTTQFQLITKKVKMNKKDRLCILSILIVRHRFLLSFHVWFCGVIRSILALDFSREDNFLTLDAIPFDILDNKKRLFLFHI